ncbi:hypothetical protein [Parabacteroides sp.]
MEDKEKEKQEQIVTDPKKADKHLKDEQLEDVTGGRPGWRDQIKGRGR